MFVPAGAGLGGRSGRIFDRRDREKENHMRQFYLGLCLALTLCASLAGQTLGEIVGAVRDSTGAVVPGATVTVTNEGTNATRTLNTNEEGIYDFPSLVPGMYRVRVEMQGFRPVTRANIELQVQQAARVDFTLELGQVSEAIEVRGGENLLTTENATVGTVIENRRIVDLPLNGRNFLQLVSLSPNVTYGFSAQGNNTRQGGARMGQNMAISGMRAVWNNYTLDGVANTDPNFNTYVVLPSVDMLQEFKVQTGIYPAEFGRAASQINVSTKGGTNKFHAAFYEFVRNDKMDAKGYAFTPAEAVQSKNPFQWNQYGYTLGGPVLIPKVFNGRDRLFFNSNYEAFRQRTRGNSYFSVPSAAMRGGDFSEVAGLDLRDPVGRFAGSDGTIVSTAFPGNRIPVSRMSPQTNVLWEFWPEPNKPSEAAAGAQPNRNYYKIQRGTIDRDQFHLRLDFNESSASSWFFRYSWSDEMELNEGIEQNGSKLLTSAEQYMLSNTRTFTPTIVNEFRFGVNTFFNSTGRELAYVRDVISELNIPGLSTPDPASWGTPRMEGFAGLSGFGDDSQGPFVVNNATFQVVDNLALIRGKSSFRFGGEVRRDRFNQSGNEFPRGSFNFAGQATQNPATLRGGYSVADFFLGYTNVSEAAVAIAFHQFRATSQYYYFDHTWRVRPGLTVNWGLRYEFSPPWYDRAQKYVNAYVPQVLIGQAQVADMRLHPTMVRVGSGDFYEDIAIRFASPIQVARDGRLGDRLMMTDKNDFAPRLGIAWSPTSKWSIRTGAGIFYSVETSNSRFDMARNLAGRVRKQGRADYPDVTMENFMGGGGAIATISSPYALGAKYDIPTTYALQYLLNVQRELSASTVFEFGYTGSISRRLQALVDLNQAIPGATGSVASRSPFPEFNAIQTVSATGRGSYNGLGMKLQRRFADGLTALVSYTWSKSIDDTSGIRGQSNDGLQYLQNSACEVCERAISSFNTPHRFVTSVLYELPFGKGRPYGTNWNRALDSVMGGWQVGSIVTIQSGRPFSANVAWSGRANVNMKGGERINATGTPWSFEQRTVEQWFNRSAFKLQPFGEFGNAGRNVLLGPGQQSWDFSAHKSFRIVEGHSLTFRFEAFNFPNHPSWALPGHAWGSTDMEKPGADFARIRGTATSMRQIQLGLKYTF
jgi:hypothetical protein